MHFWEIQQCDQQRDCDQAFLAQSLTLDDDITDIIQEDHWLIMCWKISEYDKDCELYHQRNDQGHFPYFFKLPLHFHITILF